MPKIESRRSLRYILRGRESSKRPHQSKTLATCEGFAALAWPANALASLLWLPDWAARDTTPVRLPPCSERLPATRPIFSALRSFPLCEGCVEGARAGGPDVDGGCDGGGAESSVLTCRHSFVWHPTACAVVESVCVYTRLDGVLHSGQSVLDVGATTDPEPVSIRARTRCGGRPMAMRFAGGDVDGGWWCGAARANLLGAVCGATGGPLAPGGSAVHAVYVAAPMGSSL